MEAEIADDREQRSCLNKHFCKKVMKLYLTSLSKLAMKQH